jgi:hypothetical protein
LLHGAKGHPAWRENHIGREPHQISRCGTCSSDIAATKTNIQPQIATFGSAQLLQLLVNQSDK